MIPKQDFQRLYESVQRLLANDLPLLYRAIREHGGLDEMSANAKVDPVEFLMRVMPHCPEVFASIAATVMEADAANKGKRLWREDGDN